MAAQPPANLQVNVQGGPSQDSAASARTQISPSELDRFNDLKVSPSPLIRPRRRRRPLSSAAPSPGSDGSDGGDGGGDEGGAPAAAEPLKREVSIVLRARATSGAISWSCVPTRLCA
ncbi:hypothetical protein WJX81_006599 [Elliptochloris bilobata]|uniref:Uncharacterized protein n=1 Tax=Elliptochloris bilobata TaxID=381761 RepID=A0AAW1RIF9_9CHLO